MSTIVIAGGGFCGVSLAAHLARLEGRAPLRVVLVERGPRPAQGVAYSTTDPAHLLNVPAGRMGAFADREGDFLAWLRAREPGVAGDAFVPRVRYAEYLAHVLETARAGTGITLEVLHDEVTGAVVDGDAVRVRMCSGGVRDARALVLATGTPPPRDVVRVDDREHYLRDPWEHGALARVHTTHPVLFIGTGLTMVDALLTLSRTGHRAGFIAVSRHGMLPCTHRDQPLPPPVLDISAALAAWNGSATALLHIVQRAAREADRTGHDWRDVINGLRPASASLWQRMPPQERARFLRHARPYWETHRHRMSTRVGAMINAMQARGELQVVAGRVAACAPRGDRVEATLRERSGRERRIEAGVVINCTGPESDHARVSDPLVADLRAQGRLVPDPLGLGIVTDAHGALVDATGTASHHLFTLGSPRRAQLWESTAVPELRAQADALARHLRDILL
jgi:uncharacterized NAD(P)/FAD-binding protein YdhS